jgi:hypothetical protein
MLEIFSRLHWLTRGAFSTAANVRTGDAIEQRLFDGAHLL